MWDIIVSLTKFLNVATCKYAKWDIIVSLTTLVVITHDDPSIMKVSKLQMLSTKFESIMIKYACLF